MIRCRLMDLSYIKRVRNNRKYYDTYFDCIINDQLYWIKYGHNADVNTESLQDYLDLCKNVPSYIQLRLVPIRDEDAVVEEDVKEVLIFNDVDGLIEFINEYETKRYLNGL